MSRKKAYERSYGDWNTRTARLDNQIERVYYSYFLMRNRFGNIVPTNTIRLQIKDTDFKVYEENGIDIENMIHKLSSASEQKKNINDFDKFYNYMRNIGLRYNHSVEVVQVEIISVSEDNSDEMLNDVSDLLQIAIRKNIRAVDMHYRYSPIKHMIINTQP